MSVNIKEWSPVAEKREDEYFRFAHPLGAAFATIGMLLLSVTFLRPELLPLSVLGPVGTVSLMVADKLPMVLKVIFYAAWTMHLIEAWMAVKLCRQKGIHPDTTRWWFFQTFICGYFSLKCLVDYKVKAD